MMQDKRWPTPDEIATESPLAIHGGPSVRSEPMPARRALGDDERAKIVEVVDYYTARGEDPGYQGNFERLYTEAFVGFLGGEGFADAVSTGTSAVYLALAALQLTKGAEVIVSPITDPGTISAITFNNLTPVLTDTRADSYNVGPEEIRERITDRTQAVVVVHAAGQAAEIDAICALARDNGLRVVEDCSQAHGATWKGRPVGTYGDIAAFSTMHRKAHISGGSGGLVFTLQEDLHRLALAHADRGKPRWRHDFDDRNPKGYLFPALNHHTDEISCAIGLASLQRLRETIEKRLEFVADLSRRLAKDSRTCRSYEFSPEDSPFFCPIVLDTSRVKCSKREFAEAVRGEGIGLNPHYGFVVSEWPWVRPYLSDGFSCPRAVAMRDGSFNLFVNENYRAQESRDVAAAIVKVESHYLIC